MRDEDIWKGKAGTVGNLDAAGHPYQRRDRRERAKIARAGGYTVKFIEGVLRKRQKENEAEGA